MKNGVLGGPGGNFYSKLVPKVVFVDERRAFWAKIAPQEGPEIDQKIEEIGNKIWYVSW